jgi:hypothetical protein
MGGALPLRNGAPLAGDEPHRHAPLMFVVSEIDAAAIRAAFDQGGEFSAAVELRRRFPGITDTTQARSLAQAIAGWTPLPVTTNPAGCLPIRGSGRGRRSRSRVTQ